jgi:hypothetical protein
MQIINEAAGKIENLIEMTIGNINQGMQTLNRGELAKKAPSQVRVPKALSVKKAQATIAPKIEKARKRGTEMKFR